MTDTLDSELGEAERLAVHYAPAQLRSGYRALFAFEASLARAVVQMRDPLPAQLRLAWWRDAVGKLPVSGGQPVLRALAETRIDGQALLALVDAWEEVAVGDGGLAAAAEQLAKQRGEAIAAFAQTPVEPALAAARCWTLAQVATLETDAARRANLLAMASTTVLPRLPLALRPLALLAGLGRRAARRGGGALLGDRISPLVAIRLGILGR